MTQWSKLQYNTIQWLNILFMCSFSWEAKDYCRLAHDKNDMICVNWGPCKATIKQLAAKMTVDWRLEHGYPKFHISKLN